MNDSYAFQPDSASPPGETIAELLEEHAMTLQQVADTGEFAVEDLHGILEARLSVSATHAAALERVFAVPVSFWLALEENYQQERLRQACHELGNQGER